MPTGEGLTWRRTLLLFPPLKLNVCCSRLHDEEQLDWWGGRNSCSPLLLFLLLLLCPRKTDWASSRHTVLVKGWLGESRVFFLLPVHWRTSSHQMQQSVSKNWGDSKEYSPDLCFHPSSILNLKTLIKPILLIIKSVWGWNTEIDGLL